MQYLAMDGDKGVVAIASDLNDGQRDQLFYLRQTKHW